ncbi:MAG: peptidoglycan editing factor PgeF [Clostridiales bacterium]|nr:peptidoglycan editing factor PgeF [Clostridiales bacterium]
MFLNKDYTNDEIIHLKKEDIEVLQFKALLKYEDEITHFFTLRKGGFSKNEFDSLNLGLFNNDNINDVKNNYIKLSNCMNIEYNNIFIPKQIHSDKVIFVDETNTHTLMNQKYIECDGGITNISNIPLVSICADCMTVLIYDVKTKYIASVHSGWKGVLNQIIVKTVNKMIDEYNSNAKDIIICIGPSICRNCFEVKNDVKQLFEEKFEYTDIIKPKDDIKYLIDLPKIVLNDLLNYGIRKENIHFANICTKCNTNDFYSYRENTVTGRMGHFIMKK